MNSGLCNLSCANFGRDFTISRTLLLCRERPDECRISFLLTTQHSPGHSDAAKDLGLVLQRGHPQAQGRMLARYHMANHHSLGMFPTQSQPEPCFRDSAHCAGPYFCFKNGAISAFLWCFTSPFLHWITLLIIILGSRQNGFHPQFTNWKTAVWRGWHALFRIIHVSGGTT